MSSKYLGEYFKDFNTQKYLNYFINKYQKIDLEYIKNYFLNSKFHDESKLYISLTNDDFNIASLSFKITFSKIIKFLTLEKDFQENLTNDDNYLHLKIRKEAFLNTIYNKRSWEDISIGFQNRQLRKPNKYNSNFWHHFTNVYVYKKHVKSHTDCSNCLVLNEDIHNIIFKNKLKDEKKYI